MIPEAFLKISFLSLVANVQLYASNGQDWVRMLEMWSPESDGEHFYSKSRVVTFFFSSLFRCSSFYLLNFKFLWWSLWAYIFAKLVLKILPNLLCTNVLWKILQHKWILEQVPTKVSNRIFVREKREKYREKNQQNDFFLLTCIYINININICIKYIKCYVTFSYETGLQVKFKIK